MEYWFNPKMLPVGEKFYYEILKPVMHILKFNPLNAWEKQILETQVDEQPVISLS